ncbi:MAG: hypothetical protein ABL970_11260 [Nitrospira sp.]
MRREHSTAVLWHLTGLMAVSINAWTAPLVDASLYECRDASGALIYTDSPAQLDRCQPIASGGTSRLGLVGGASASAPQTSEPVSSFPPPIAPPPVVEPGLAVIPPAMPTGGLAPSGGAPVGLAGGSANAPPCMPGINPLNPFSGPPCDTAPQIIPQPTPSSPGNP